MFMDVQTIAVIGMVTGGVSASMSIIAVGSGIIFYRRQEFRFFEESLPAIRPVYPPRHHEAGQLDLAADQSIGWRNFGRSSAQNFCAVLFGSETKSAGCYWQYREYSIPSISETPRGELFATQPMSKCTNPLRGSMRIGGHSLYVSPWDES